MTSKREERARKLAEEAYPDPVPRETMSQDDRDEIDMARRVYVEALLAHPPDADGVDIVFDGPPGPEAGRFVEVENANGESIKFGKWVERPDGYWVLRIDSNAEVERLRGEFWRLRGMFEWYGQHLPACKFKTLDCCTCGFAEALAQPSDGEGDAPAPCPSGCVEGIIERDGGNRLIDLEACPDPACPHREVSGE